jgi:hypothetical protein
MAVELEWQIVITKKRSFFSAPFPAIRYSWLAQNNSAVRHPCFPKVKMACGASIVFCGAKLPLLSGV